MSNKLLTAGAAGWLAPTVMLFDQQCNQRFVPYGIVLVQKMSKIAVKIS